MEYLKAFVKIFLVVLIGVGMGLIIFLFSFWFFIAFIGMLGVFLSAWAVGIPLTIKERGKKVGHVRWFTFYPNK
jgi:hypothetical protein